MNPIDITILKPSLYETGLIATWKYYYFENRAYSRKHFAYFPTKTISGWIWFETYYQWYNCTYSIKGISAYESIKTIKDIARFDYLRDIQTLHTNHFRRICSSKS